jgi:hypothetical protein
MSEPHAVKQRRICEMTKTRELKRKLAAAALQLAVEYEHETVNAADDSDPDEGILVIGQIAEGLIISCRPWERKVLLNVIEAFEQAESANHLHQRPGTPS